MRNQLIDIAEKAYLKKSVPEFHIGDTVDVTCRIIEGTRERLQVFNGTVIARRHQGINETFAVRRIVNNEGVERIFMLHSPLIANIEVKRRGKARRAKLYFLRGRVGKARRLKERRTSSAARAARFSVTPETTDTATQESETEAVNA
jgi:large subunit ribosomal protein L19